jgi:hypothetical protein
VTKPASQRATYAARPFLLSSDAIRDRAIAAIQNAPIDPLRPLQVLVREEVKQRKPDQNALMWSGPLADIAAQAWIGGRQYSADVWHEHFKREHLPEEYDPELCKEGYRKWDFTPGGERILVGSTTQLTVRGFARYLTQVESDGAGMGVTFHVRDERRAA